MIKDRCLNQILFFSVAIRLIVLVTIILCSDKLPSLGFIGNSPLYDDYRYEQGAVLYVQNAEHIIDTRTFTNVYDSLGDWTGHNLVNPLVSTPLWYWICCILVYITRTRWSIRILNIIVFSISMIYIWNITNEIYGRKIAKLTTRLMGYLPYSIVFSCFSYKDIFVMGCTFYLLWKAIEIKKGIFNWKTLVSIVACLLCMLFTRSGLIVVWLLLLVGFIFEDKIKRKINVKYLVLMVLAIGLGIFLIVKFSNTLLYKFLAYNTGGNENELGLGKIVKITSLSQIWKLPFTYIFSVLQPLQLFKKCDTWYGIISNINIIMLPIAIGSMLYIIIEKKKNKMFFWILLVYYLITAISSILVFRQLFSLLPIPYIFFSALWESQNNQWKKILIVFGSFVLGTVLIVLYAI